MPTEPRSCEGCRWLSDLGAIGYPDILKCNNPGVGRAFWWDSKQGMEHEPGCHTPEEERDEVPKEAG